jgi:hypothetical protein
MRRLFTVGLSRDTWQQIQWPDHLDEVGYFSADRFDPLAWRPISPHAAMANLDDRDGYWAAKIVAAFTDADLRILVEQGRYQDPRAVDYLVEHLGRRRDIIARTWFDQIAPLDFFQLADGRLVGHDLGVERGVYPAEAAGYRWRWRPVRANRGSAADWSEPRRTGAVALDVADLAPATAFEDHGFLAVQWQVQRDDGWQDPVTVYLDRTARRVVAVDR